MALRPGFPLVLSGFLLGAATLFDPAAARAQSCPPGMMAAGGGSAGWFGCAPVYDPWQGVSTDPDPTPGWARGPSIDPLAGRIAAATTLFELEARQMEDLQRRLVSDPEFAKAYRRYTDGAWELFLQTDRRQCAALFSREGSFVLMFEIGGSQPGALLVFVGRGLPTPTRPRSVRVELRQNRDATAQSVKAFSYRVPETEYGALALSVPTMSALLDNMLEEHSFALSLDDREAFEIAWRGGVASRDALARCVAANR